MTVMVMALKMAPIWRRGCIKNIFSHILLILSHSIIHIYEVLNHLKEILVMLEFIYLKKIECFKFLIIFLEWWWFQMHNVLKRQRTHTEYELNVNKNNNNKTPTKKRQRTKFQLQTKKKKRGIHALYSTNC